MSDQVVDVEVIKEDDAPPAPLGKKFRQEIIPPPEESPFEKIQKAVKITQEVIEDPNSVMTKRILPKSGTEPLPFEDEEYLQDQHTARDRVNRSQKTLGSTKGDQPGQYLPLKYDPKLLEQYYMGEPVQVLGRMFDAFTKSSGYISQLLVDNITGTQW